MIETMLTTFDNPYDPFTEWDPWYAFDEAAGHATSGLLARITVSSNDLPEPVQQQAINDAIDEILREDVTGLYLKVTREVKDSEEE